MHKIMFWASLLLLAIGATSLRAQERALTLRDAVAQARRQSPDVLAARARAEAARQESRAAGSYRLPTVGLEAGAIRSDDPVAAFGGRLRQGRFAQQDFDPAGLNHPAALTDWSGAVGATWAPVDFSADAGYRAAQAEADGAGLGARWAARAAAFRAEARYLEAVGAQKRLEAAGAALEAAESNAHRAELRLNQGMLTEADVLQARAALQGARAQHIDAQRGVDDARGRLAVALGWPAGPVPVPTDTSFALATAATAAAPTDGAHREGVRRNGTDVERAGRDSTDAERAGRDGTDPEAGPDLEARPDLMASLAGVHVAEARVQQAGRARLPRIEGFAQLSTHAPQAFSGTEHDWTVGLKLSVPLFTGMKITAMQHAASAMRDATLQEHAQRVRQAEAEVAEARRGMGAARQGVAAAEAGAAAAQEAARLMRRRFEEGLITTADLLAAEAQAASLRTQAVNARLGLHLATARLAFLTDTTTADLPGGLDR